jgi:hypothetical protein
MEVVFEVKGVISCEKPMTGDRKGDGVPNALLSTIAESWLGLPSTLPFVSAGSEPAIVD